MTGRNEVCPCGSGQKYKKCCGGVNQLLREADPFLINREIAYIGRIGQRREQFCLEYIQQKKQQITLMQEALLKRSEAEGKSIQCHKGCSNCCAQNVPLLVQEAEAIVYHLYHNEDKLKHFLEAYPIWRAKVGKNETLFKEMGQNYNTAFANQFKPEHLAKYQLNSEEYLGQNIPCPFLIENICGIYDVRPFACASLVAVTPPEYCSASSAMTPSIYTALHSPDFATQFYRKMDAIVFSPTPLAVYQLLLAGIMWISLIPGLAELDREFMTDPEVLRKLNTRASRW